VGVESRPARARDDPRAVRRGRPAAAAGLRRGRRRRAAVPGPVLAELRGAGRRGARGGADSITIRRPAEFRAHVVDGHDFFDAGNHPEISFASTRIEIGEDGTLDIDGELTMRGQTRPVSATGVYVAPVEDLYGQRRAAIDLAAEIDRRDWGMSFQAELPRGGDVLSWTVALSIQLELVADGD
jgi:hypothetical protein